MSGIGTRPARRSEPCGEPGGRNSAPGSSPAAGPLGGLLGLDVDPLARAEVIALLLQRLDLALAGDAEAPVVRAGAEPVVGMGIPDAGRPAGVVLVWYPGWCCSSFQP